MRSLARSRGFTIAAILTLALGIGATTAIYSVVDTILLQPLPFPDSDRLVRVIENFPHVAPGRPSLQRGITHQEFLDWRTRAKTLTDTTAVIGDVATNGADARGRGRTVGRHGVGQHLRAAADARRCWDARSARVTRPIPMSSCSATTPGNAISRRSGHRRKALEFRTGALLAPIPPRLLTVVGVLPADFEFPTGRAGFLHADCARSVEAIAPSHMMPAGSRRVAAGRDGRGQR